MLLLLLLLMMMMMMMMIQRSSQGRAVTAGPMAEWDSNDPEKFDQEDHTRQTNAM